MADRPAYGLLASGAQAFRIEAKLDLVLSQLGIVIRDESLVLQKETTLMTTLADIKTALDAQSDKLTALAARIAAQANSGAPDPAALQAIADELTAHNASIDALDVPVAPAATDPNGSQAT